MVNRLVSSAARLLLRFSAGAGITALAGKARAFIAIEKPAATGAFAVWSAA
jgi:hypothetical protein